jgi:hypothetical protein
VPWATAISSTWRKLLRQQPPDGLRAPGPIRLCLAPCVERGELRTVHSHIDGFSVGARPTRFLSARN